MSNKAQAVMTPSEEQTKPRAVKRQPVKANGDTRRMLEDRIADDRLSREIRDFHFDF